MKKYFDEINDELREYFSILSSDIPDFIKEYINTKEMRRLGYIGQFCGVDYTNLPFYNLKYFFSRLDHSVAVALIVWNFTKDKKASLAGLFHDISTPVFSHAVDFMKGDALNQEITEEKTESIIKNSKEIMLLLSRDNINIDEVSDYKKYPIADNERPKLSADRLEGLFSAQLVWINSWSINDIKEIYSKITIHENEQKIDELSFDDKAMANKFTMGMLELSYRLQEKEDKLTLSFLGDILKTSIEENIINENDLFVLGEQDVIKRIKWSNCTRLTNAWDFFENMKEVKSSDEEIRDKYTIQIQVKKRYIDPLVIEGNNINRITKISPEANNNIKKFINTQDDNYSYIDYKL